MGRQYEVEDPSTGQRYIVEQQDGPGVLERAGTAVKQFGANVVSGFGQMASEAPRAAAWLTTPPWETKSGEAYQGFMNREADRGRDFYKQFGEKYGSGPGYSKSIGEAIGGGLAAGGVTPVAALAAAGAGAGGEASANLFGDTFLTRGLGALAGGGLVGTAAGIASRRFPNTEALAREGLQGIDEATLQRAAQFQAAQRAKGVDVDLAQALAAIGAPASNLTTIRDFLANKPQGDRLQKTLREQPGQLSQEADLTVARLPGTNFGPSQSANNLQQAATDAINAAKQERSRQVRRFYGAAGVLTPAQVKELRGEVEAFVNQPGISTDVKAAANRFLRQIEGQDNELVKAVEDARKALAGATDAKSRMAAQQALAQANDALTQAGSKPVSALDVDTWIGEMSGAFKGTPINPVDPKAAGQMKGLTGKVNKKFQDLSPEVKRAEQEFARLSEELVNPIKQSVVGQVATPRGYRPDVQATMAKFDALMERGTDANSKVSDIRTLGTQLAQVDKNAFADALKVYVSRKVRSAMEPGATSQTAANNPDMAQRIAQALWGNELKAQGLRDAVAIAAKSQGQDPALAVRGLNNLMQLVKAMESRPRTVGGLMNDDIYRISGRNTPAEGLRTFGFLPFERTARRLEDTVMASTMKEFDKILTTPEGAKLLTDLGRESVMSRKIPTLLAQFGAQFVTNPAGVMPE